MPFSIVFTASAAREFKKLPKDLQRRISRTIDELAENAHPPGSKKLMSEENIYRVRAGDYRILYQVQSARLVVLVLKIGHRREVYR
jgi:mRNA interferase RelE/StbE